MREAVRDADNVSEKITPIVRIRNLGDSALEWEIKYWLEDYAKYNDTDALVRQRTWYALRRNGLTFAFPTRTLHLERKITTRPTTAEDEIADRLSAVELAGAVRQPTGFGEKVMNSGIAALMRRYCSVSWPGKPSR